MDKEISSEILKALVELSYQFGPFFFALLFLLWISRWGYKKYTETCVRLEPKASLDEIKTKKNYFKITTYFGLLLVLVSIYWWFQFRSMNHVFSGRVEGLKEYQETISSSLFIKSVFQKSLIDGVPTPHQDHFIITKKGPFVNGETFDIGILIKSIDGKSSLKLFEIEYSGQNYIRLKYDVEAGTGDPILKPIKCNSNKISFQKFSLIRAVYAGADSILKQIKKTTKETGNYYELKGTSSDEHTSDVPKSYNIDNAIETLQNERASVLEKINALNILLLSDKKIFEENIYKLSYPEPLILTVEDLKRHTDKEIAEKARILSKRTSLKAFVTKINRDSLLEQEDIEKIILCLDPDTGMNLLRTLVADNELNWAEELLGELEKQTKRFMPLIPTGSTRGDRYYVKAEWDSDNKSIVECLTQLFNESLISNRTLEEEKKMMANRNERFVYWYSKNWARGIAKAINNCGANATFVGF